MGNYLYGRDLKEEWIEQKYIRMDNFLSSRDKTDLRNVIEHLEGHRLCNKVQLMNNHSVENRGRTQALLFSDNFKTEKQEEATELDNYFDFVMMNLNPIIMPKIREMFKIIGLGMFRILRITIHYIPPGEPEQQIHHDGHPCDNIFYMSIPLHDTTPEMGSTIVYNDKYVKQYRKEFKPESLEYYNQVESFEKMPEGEKKNNFKKARNDKPMKYGDCVFYRDITFHHGAANKSKVTRKYLHIFLSEPTTRWVDFFEVRKNGVFMVNSFQEMMGLNRVIKSIR
tara:strand:+ start:672 stop:1517 length:846 start_codon:yes stop_codon:yes gene_type:complete